MAVTLTFVCTIATALTSSTIPGSINNPGTKTLGDPSYQDECANIAQRIQNDFRGIDPGATVTVDCDIT